MKLLWIMVLTLALAVTLLWTTSALANEGPHGTYGATTDACAGCHRAHTATGPKLLVAATAYDLCITCHGSMAGGAQTNVVDGVYAQYRSAGVYTDKTAPGSQGTKGDPLLGGGFSYYKTQGGSFAAVTSIHDANGSTAAAWGNGVNRGVTGALSGGNLSCVSCHDPHGNTNYRILKTTVNGVAVSVAQVDESSKNYTTEQWGAGQSQVCAACHGAYHKAAAGQGQALDNGTYTHRVDMAYEYTGDTIVKTNPEAVGMSGYKLPLVGTSGSATNVVVCQTCHLPHGTSAAMGGYANNGGPPGNTGANASSLLRLPNRGVCEVCHQK